MHRQLTCRFAFEQACRNLLNTFRRILLTQRLNLPNEDELHLVVGKLFWCEWFPCIDPKKVQSFRDAVEGVLSGEYRVVEFYRGNRAVKAGLQQIENDLGTKIATSAKLIRPFFGRMRTQVVQNAPDTIQTP